MEPADLIASAKQPQEPHATPAPLTQFRVVIEEHYRTVHIVEAESEEAAEDMAYDLVGEMTTNAVAERSDVDITVEPSRPG
jgi:hypothetical protein